ncbi:MAG: LTA synthase family protein [Bacteroidaceae bacterium]
MKQRLHFLEILFCHLLIVFMVGRIVFVFYNRHVETLSLNEIFGACRDGLLSHDFVVAAVFLLPASLLAFVASRRPNMPLRAILTPYYALAGFVVALIVVADVVMYEFWQFKLNAVVLSYAASPEGASNSVSLWFIISRVSTVIAFVLWVVLPCVLITPQRVPDAPVWRTFMRNVCLIMTGLSIVGLTCVRVGDSYDGQSSLFRNHASVNSVLAFFSSFSWTTDPAARFDYLDEAEREAIYAGLYPDDTEDIQDTLLMDGQPDVLIVFMESFGGRFVQELGGLPDVSPNWSRFIPEGIFWDNYYSCSFRTDRGTVSTFSGMLSYPDICLMKETWLHPHMSSLAVSMGQAGYHTIYHYPCAMTNMGKRDYLQNMGFQELMDDTAYEPGEMNSTWGANDSTSAMKTFRRIEQKDSTEHLFMVYQTVSSHEPWVVPYNRLPDEKLNAFAYTDYSVGLLIDSLKTLPLWDNLLVIMIPDHGYLYKQSYEDPEFFHSPMLWLGGAIRHPRRMQVLMNQSDLSATLLSQLGISHRDYVWSRNVLSRNYTYPFVYCCFPAGIMWKDNTGVTLFDITANSLVTDRNPGGEERLRKAQSVLQTGYDWYSRQMHAYR